MKTEKKADTKREFLRCSMVVVAFYLIVYVLIGGKLTGFFNPWLIGIIVVLAVIDIVVLHKYIGRFLDEDEDQYP